MNSGVDLESLSRWCELYLGARLDAVLFETGFSTRVLGGCATAMRSCLSYGLTQIGDSVPGRFTSTCGARRPRAGRGADSSDRRDHRSLPGWLKQLESGKPWSIAN